MTTLASNKDSAAHFLAMVVAGNIKEAYDTHMSADFHHHNAYYKSDRASLQKGMEENHAQFPSKTFETKRILEDGDLVAVHSRVQLSPAMPVIAVVHIFRFENGKIAEMWDIGQQLTDPIVNETGVF